MIPSIMVKGSGSDIAPHESLACVSHLGRHPRIFQGIPILIAIHFEVAFPMSKLPGHIVCLG